MNLVFKIDYRVIFMEIKDYFMMKKFKFIRIFIRFRNGKKYCEFGNE